MMRPLPVEILRGTTTDFIKLLSRIPGAPTGPFPHAGAQAQNCDAASPIHSESA
jgi:hypothetical protein